MKEIIRTKKKLLRISQKEKITQTDHLNKRLLDSFLQRINESSARVPVVERISTSDTEEDFESDNTQASDNKIQ